MKILAVILLIWLFFTAVGTIFGILGKVIWAAVIFSLIALVVDYLKKD